MEDSQENLDKSRIKDPKQAEEEAYKVRAFVGKKIDLEYEKMMLMSKFPGFEEEIRASARRIKELQEKAVEELETGKEWAIALGMAFGTLKEKDGHDFGNFFKDNSLDLSRFAKYIEAKFGPFQSSSSTPNGKIISYFKIKGTPFEFTILKNSGSGEVEAVTLIRGKYE